MRKSLILILIILFSNKLLSKDVWIYSDDGTWQDGIIALEQFFDYYKISHKRVFASDLNTIDDLSSALALCFPGGYAYNYKINLTNKTIDNIRNYVAKGGSYIGICAGAYFASSNVVWEGEEYPYSLSLFKGKAVGSIHSIAAWDNYSMTKIIINKKNKIIQSSQDSLTTLYYGGPYFVSNETKFDTIAIWDEYNGFPAIINFNYELGKVLLIGAHLEIEEDDYRDSTSFAQELNDEESDWEFLNTIVKWVLNTETSVDKSYIANNNLVISPNPASDYIEINIERFTSLQKFCTSEIQIYNTFGECVLTTPSLLDTPSEQGNVRIDISHLPAGLYFIQIGDYIGKFSLIK